MTPLRRLFICLIFSVAGFSSFGQLPNIFYQYAPPGPFQNMVGNRFGVGFGMYGRVGASWNFVEGASIGRRLNLNNMGSIGGRMEEQDYLEFGTTFTSPKMTKDSTVVRVQLRASVFSTSLTFFGGENTRSAGGIAIGLPEIFVEARDVFTKRLNIWIGNRLYRGPDVHIADYFYFNDRSGQGAGIEYKNTMLHVQFVTSTDTSATVPPYFYVNTKTGTPSLELRERVILSAEQSFNLKGGAVVTVMGEYHDMPGPDEFIDSVSIPGDKGFVLGARIQFDLKKHLPGSFNQFTARLGTGIANGADGGSSRTWLTYGAPNFDTKDFSSARGVEIVDHFLINYSDRFTLNGYAIYHFNRGAADTNGEAPTYFDRIVFNRKEDFTIGGRGFYYFSDIFHLLTELHYQQRKDGEQDWYRMVKVSIAPTIVPFGERSAWSRPHLRFVTSIARYNDLAQQNLYSPYLQLVGPEKWGFYFGFKAEWWTW